MPEKTRLNLVGRPDDIDEHNDCAIRALVLASGVDYRILHVLAATLGRVNLKAMRTIHIKGLLACLRKMGMPIHKMAFIRPRRLSTFCRTYNRGNYYVRIRGHMVAVLDGRVSDDSAVGSIVLDAWRIG